MQRPSIRPLQAVLVVVTSIVAGCGLFEANVGLACQEPPEGNWIVGEREVPNLRGMTPEAAAVALDSADIDASWRYSYATDANEPNVGYSECWCAPPPDGVVDNVTTAEEGWLIVFVNRTEPIFGGRPQPELGWECAG